MTRSLYRESMRRLARLGIALLVISVVLTVIIAAGSASETSVSKMLDGPFSLLPVLMYFVFVGGVGFAFAGFSFLNKRRDSDFYHSIPVRRTDVFLSVALSALTWTVATVVLCVLASMTVYLFLDVPFVSGYYLMSIPFFIVATMLTFAAAAIACSVTGNLMANIVLTGLVLFLPRFILFFVARSIVANTWIVGWRDFSGLLNPNTNIVTGMLVMQTRSILKADIMRMGNILWSLALTCIELGIGLVLFARRPSELAERSAFSNKWQTLFACLLSFPVMLLFFRSPRRLTFMVVLATSLIIFLIYQFIVLRSPKRVFKTLPWYACTAALSVGMYFAMIGISTAVLNTTPAADQIKSVQFTENWQGTPRPWYSTLQVSNVVFTENSVKEYTAKSLAAAVSRVKSPHYSGERYFEEGAHNTVESVIITLNNGRKIRRSIEFSNLNILNDARKENPQFVSAIHAFAPREEIKFLTGAYSNYMQMSAEDAEKLRTCFVEEYAAGNLESNSYYGKQEYRIDSKYFHQMYTADEDQYLGGFTIHGYEGLRRFQDFYNITLKTPKTAALYMMLSNNVVKPDVVYNADFILKLLRDKAPANGYLNINCTFINVPMLDGTKQQINLPHYGNVYNGKYDDEQSSYGPADAELMEQILAVLQRGIPTSDPSVMFAMLYYDSNVRFTSATVQEDRISNCSGYLAFTKEDESQLLNLISEWNEKQYERQRIYNADFEAASILVD